MTDERVDARPQGATSAHLKNVAERAARMGSITIEEMMTVMGSSSIAFTILILSLGADTATRAVRDGIRQLSRAYLFTITAGTEHLQLPRFIRKRRLSAATVIFIVRYTAPMIARVERVLRPDRLGALTGRKARCCSAFPSFF